MKKPLRHILDYLILCIIVSVGIILILIYSGNPVLQRLVVVTLSALYVIWGVLHHLKEKTFHLQILVEYSLIALLGSLLVLGLF